MADARTLAVAAAALGAGWCFGLVYPTGTLPNYTYYASPLELPLTLIALALAFVLFFPSKKLGALTKCPATAWPAGKPMLAKPADYPLYDHIKDPKGSFTKICDMLIAEVKDELPKMYALPQRENEWIHHMLEYNTKGGKMTRGLMVVETATIIFKARGLPIDNAAMCKFAVLGWCIEWLQARPWPSTSPRLPVAGHDGNAHTMCMHAGVAARGRRHHGRVAHAPRPTLLVQVQGGRPHRHQRRGHHRGARVQDPQAPLRARRVLPPAGRAGTSTVLFCWCRSSLPWPPGADSPGTWLRRALGTSS